MSEVSSDKSRKLWKIRTSATGKALSNKADNPFAASVFALTTAI